MKQMNLNCIVLGMGPSLFEWLKGKAADRGFPAPYDASLKIPYIGTGKSAEHVPLNSYCYACVPKRDQVPGYPVTVWAREEVIEPGMVLFPPYLPRGGSAGGMALSLAASYYQHIGLVGFDGGSNVPDYFVSDFIGLIRYWKARGKMFYSLMPESVFDHVLEPIESER